MPLYQTDISVTFTMSEVIVFKGMSLGSCMRTSCSSATIQGKSCTQINTSHATFQIIQADLFTHINVKNMDVANKHINTSTLGHFPRLYVLVWWQELKCQFKWILLQICAITVAFYCVSFKWIKIKELDIHPHLYHLNFLHVSSRRFPGVN